MKVLFRADSSSSIGLGHIMRDLVLAENYKNDTVFFACQNLNGNIIETIPYEVKILQSNKTEELIELVKSLHVDLLIIDHYDITYENEKAIKDATNVKILSFDDTYQKHYCDVLLNHNISAKPEKYKNLVPLNCELRCGSKYTLIRDEFKKEKELKRAKIYDVFVAMGGADTSNLNISILKSLPESLEVSVLTTSSNTHLEEVKKYVTCKDNISLHVNSKEVAKLMNQSKFAIITPSVMVHEVLFMNLSFLAIKTASNQDDIYTYLKENNYTTIPKWDEQEFKKCLKI